MQNPMDLPPILSARRSSNYGASNSLPCRYASPEAIEELNHVDIMMDRMSRLQVTLGTGTTPSYPSNHTVATTQTLDRVAVDSMSRTQENVHTDEAGTAGNVEAADGTSNSRPHSRSPRRGRNAASAMDDPGNSQHHVDASSVHGTGLTSSTPASVSSPPVIWLVTSLSGGAPESRPSSRPAQHGGQQPSIEVTTRDAATIASELRRYARDTRPTSAQEPAGLRYARQLAHTISRRGSTQGPLNVRKGDRFLDTASKRMEMEQAYVCVVVALHSSHRMDASPYRPPADTRPFKQLGRYVGKVH